MTCPICQGTKVVSQGGSDTGCDACQLMTDPTVSLRADAITTLDVFLAAYPEQPDSKALLDDDDLLTFGTLRTILAALAQPAPPTEATPPHDGLREADPEAAAWEWLDRKFLNVEAGDDPNDRAYSTDEMVDAFIAGMGSKRKGCEKCAWSGLERWVGYGNNEEVGLCSFCATAALSPSEVQPAGLGHAEGWIAGLEEAATFKLGDRVEKVGGASWRGIIVGTYRTSLTPEGYAVESEREPGSVQIYPVKALRTIANEGTAA